MSAGTELTDRRPASASIPLSRGPADCLGGPKWCRARMWNNCLRWPASLRREARLLLLKLRGSGADKRRPPLETENNNTAVVALLLEDGKISRRSPDMGGRAQPFFPRQQLAALRESASAAPAAATADWCAVNAPPVCPAAAGLLLDSAEPRS